MAAPDAVVNLAEKFAAFEDHWSPKIIGHINDLHLKAVKVQGEFVWHQHDDTDEFSLVISGRLTTQLRDREGVTIGSNEFFVVPRGVQHCPIAKEECEILLLEPANTVNTGDTSDTSSPHRTSGSERSTRCYRNPVNSYRAEPANLGPMGRFASAT